MNKTVLSLVALFLLAAAAPSVDTGRMQRMAALLGAEPTLDPAFQAGADRAEKAVDELVAEALRSHPAVVAEKRAHQAREALVDASVANAYQPKVAATLSLGENRTRSLSQELDTKSRDQSYGLSLRQNLWRGGRDGLDIEIAEADEQLAGLGARQKTEAVRFNACRAALQYNYQAMQQLLSEEAAKDSSELRRLSERKFQAGQVGRIDVHQASMRETDAKASVAKASLATRQAYFALLKSLGFAAGPGDGTKSAIEALAKASLPFPLRPPALTGTRTNTLAEDNAALAATKAGLTASSTRRGRYLPEVDLSASATRSESRTGGDLPEETDKTARLGFGVELTWPLWERSLDHRVAAATLEREAAEAKATDARSQATLAAAELKQKIEDLYEALPIYRNAYVEAGKLYDARIKVYEAGAVDVFVVTEADSQRLQALRTWYDAVHEIRLTLLKWKALEAGYVPES